MISRKIKFNKAKKGLIQDMINSVKTEGLDNSLIVPIISAPYKKYGFYLSFTSTINIDDLQFRKYHQRNLCNFQ